MSEKPTCTGPISTKSLTGKVFWFWRFLKVQTFCVSDVACPQIPLPSPYSQIVNRETAMLSSCLLLILCQQLAFAWRHCVPCIRPWVSGPACYSSAYYLWTAHCALYQTMDINLGMLFFCILFLNSTLCPISGHGYLSGLAILLHSVFQQRNVPYIWPCMPFLFCISCLFSHCWLFSLQSFTHMLSSHCLNPTSLSQNQMY